MRADAPQSDRARLPWIALGLGLCILALAFGREIRAAIGVWNESTAYGHCWLVLPVALWLLWERRSALAALAPRPALWPASLVVPLASLWLLADLLGIMEGRQLAFIGFVQALLMAALGWRLWWALSPSLLYLFFLVPFGAFLTPALQHVTTSFIAHGLAAVGIPFQVDMFRITIPEGAFYVAEACAGLRFLIASVAFGVLFAVTMFRSPWRRAAFIGISCVMPVLANGVRALGIVLLGHWRGSAEAGAADHLIYGWIFFCTVIALLAACGLPFRQAKAAAPAREQAGEANPRALAGCAMVLALSLAAPAAASLFQSGAAGAPIAAVPLLINAPASCEALASVSHGPVQAQSFRCAGQRITVTSTVLPRASNPSAILQTARSEAAAGLRGEVDSQVRQIGGAAWVVLSARGQGGSAAYALRADGQQMAGGLHDRIRLAGDMFTAGPPPVALVVAVMPGQDGAEDTLRRFLAEAHFKSGV